MENSIYAFSWHEDGVRTLIWGSFHGTDRDELVVWMDWTQPTGLESPAPAHFIGGTEELPAGSTKFFNVNLKPGRYAWIAEVPRADEKGMLVTFTVPFVGSE